MSNEEDRKALDAAIGSVRWGDGTPLIGKVVGDKLIDALIADGFHRTPAPVVDISDDMVIVHGDEPRVYHRQAPLTGEELSDEEVWTDARIREAFIYDGGLAEYYDPIHGAATQRAVAGTIFDVWLAAHDSKIRAAVSTPQAPEWEYGAGYEADNGIEMRWFSMGSGAFTIREAAEQEVERFADPQIRLVRRPRPGPWEPVPDEGVTK